MKVRLQQLARVCLIAGVFPAWIELSCPAYADGVVTNMTQTALLNAMTNGGTVTFTNSGTITLSQTITVRTNTVLNGAGYEVILSGGYDNDPESTNGVRLFTVNPGIQFTLQDLTLADGRSTAGGAIYNQGLLGLEDCVLTNNIALGADGTAGIDGTDGELQGKPGGSGGGGAPASGGVLFNAATTTAARCLFVGNSATGGAGGGGGNGGDGSVFGGNGGAGGSGAIGKGGVIYNQSKLSVTESTFKLNRAVGGAGGAGGTNGVGSNPSFLGQGGAGAVGAGAAIYSLGECEVTASTLTDNHVQSGDSGDGGGVAGTGGAGPAGADAFGGGIANYGLNRVLNCTFYTNSVAGGNGGNGGYGSQQGGNGGNGGSAWGGNYYNQGQALITNCTFSSGNTIPGTNGLAGGGGSLPGQNGAYGAWRGDNIGNAGSAVILKNTIVAYWVSSGNFYGPVTDAGYNINSDITPPFTGPGSSYSIDPLLYTLDDYGGPTETMEPQDGSPAIDSGDPNFCLPTDQRGVTRPYPFGGRCDIGAFEYGASALPPVITLDATNQTVLRSSNATFYVTAESDVPVTYRWYFQATNIVQTVTNEQTGTTTNSLTRSNVQLAQEGEYQVVVGNQFGAATSEVATLTVQVPLKILTNPVSQSVTQGSTVVFSVVVESSANLTYEWQRNGVTLPGATSSNLTLVEVSASDAGGYRVVISSSDSERATSQEATLTVTVPQPPVITVQPTNRMVYPGATAEFVVAAAGDAPLRYQWYFEGLIVPEQTNTSLTLINAQKINAGMYTVVITNSLGAVTSAPVSLIILEAPVITVPPTNLSVIQGETATFQIEATGSPDPGFQWYFGGTAMAGATGNTLVIANAQTTNAGSYRVTVSNAAGSVDSASVQLTVHLPPTITQDPLSQLVFEGEPVMFSVTATGDTPFTYQWFFKGNLISGATGDTYLIPVAYETNEGAYRVEVSNAYGSDTSLSASLTVNSPLRITDQPPSQILARAGRAVFSVGVKATGILSYQWMHNGANLPGANLSSLSINNLKLTDAGEYEVVTWNDLGERETSDPAVLSVFTPLSNVEVDQGDTATFNLTVSSPAPLTYQWSTDGMAIAGATNSTYSVTNAQPEAAGLYRVTLTDESGATNSTAATLSVRFSPGITNQPLNLVSVAGRDARLDVEVVGYPTPDVQWRFGNADIPDATGSELLLPNVQTTNVGAYSVVVSNSVGATTNLVAALMVISHSPNAFGLSFLSTNGVPYALDYADGIPPTSWTSVVTNAASGGVTTLTDPAPTADARFYRVRVLPTP